MRKTGVIFAGLILVSLPALATTDLRDAALAEYPSIDETRLDSCSLCHTDVPELNDYGQDFLGAGFDFGAIEGDDSDGDGLTNLAEIMGLTFPGDIGDPGLATVPSVVGLSEGAAETAITGAGLIVGTVTQVASDTVPAGDVISQDPAAGTDVAVGSEVDLEVSTGPAAVTVPDVVGLTQASAEMAITTADLTVGTVTQEASDTVPAGTVISQLPTAGTQAAPGSEVSLVISAGPSPVTVPDVVGQSQASATTEITGAGLTVGTVTMQSSATVPAGDVISQDPAAGTLAAPDSAVDLVVSTGPGLVTVPNVVGLTQSAATTAITNAGLAVGTVSDAASATVPAGSVISQSPVSGVEVAAGSDVDLVISTGPATGTGSLQVFIEPEAARDLGAQWRVDGGVFRDSGAVVTLAAGVHTVSFRDIGCDGLSGCFAGCTKAMAAGSAGDGSAGELARKVAVRTLLESLDAEKQNGCFAPCPVDFVAPSDEVITIVAGETLVIEATYTEQNKTAPAAVVGNFGGDTILLALMMGCLAAGRFLKTRKRVG